MHGYGWRPSESRMSQVTGGDDVKRRWNIALWLGLLVVVAAAATYFPIIERFPSQGELPWATLLIFIVGLLLIARGLVRAFREPQTYRGKIAGSLVMVAGIGLVGFFAFGTLYLARQVPRSEGAPRVGQRAPEFTLRDKDDRAVTLADLIGAGNADHVNGVVLIFYRGYW